MRYCWLVVVFCLGSVQAQSDEGYAKVFIGTYDMFRDNQDTQYGLEIQSPRGLSRYDFKPLLGLMRTREQSHYLYTGVSRTSFFTAGETGLAFTFSFGPGLYFYGEGEDTDLGHVFELKSSGGLIWQFADATRIGLHYAHLSNASISLDNPGTEMVTLTYQLPFWR
ncbi:hypothetical protein BGP77_13610 [Saccharospirillum sp. MSK14-1]|uniref:acyloxyacyl hydrolase n=1 Tax=Saccharospirillum sp. MSK14-1 TaxID=1897632 RepID=UPI000D3AF4E0|nr:acyloxyacyl hydrolase [Saccharospirillum sp. MSK14-1]PTY37532.1 hypothetical protein BGP77_13610 [Saccharospirillum sp. MSK14-1]